MTNDTGANPPNDDLDEEFIPLRIVLDPEHLERVERLAARSGRTAQELLEDFVVQRLGPLGIRFVR